MFSPSTSASPYYSDQHPKMWTNFNHYNPLIPEVKLSKRKMQFYEEIKPSKILVTEDMMANQLDGIHLSNDYTSHGAQQSSLDDPTPSTSGMSMLSRDLPREFLPKLTMCDELRALKDSISILPKVLEPERPSTALILWQPPAGDLGKYLQYQMDKQKDKSENSRDGSEMSSEDQDKLPPLPVESGMDVELENNNTDMTCAYNGFSRAI